MHWVFSRDNLKPSSSAFRTTMLIADCNFLLMSPILLAEQKMVRSSTYRQMPTSQTDETNSLTAMAKRVTLRVEPCGTPFSWTVGEDNDVPTRTLNLRFAKKDVKTSGKLPRKPQSCNFLRMPYRQVMS